MQPWCRLAMVMAVVGASSVGFSQSLVGATSATRPDAHKQLAEAQANAAKLQTAEGWKQVGVLESFFDPGGPYPAQPKGPPTRPANPNVFAFVDNERLVLADGKNPIRIVEAKSGRVMSSFGEPLGNGLWGRKMVISHDGKYMVIVPSAAPEIWNLQTGKAIGELPKAEKTEYLDAVFLADGKLAVLRSDVNGNRMKKSAVTIVLGPQGVTVSKEAVADINAQSLMTAGKYLAVTATRSTQVFEADTLEQVYTTDNSQYMILFIHAEQVGATLGVLRVTDVEERWTQMAPVLLQYTIPDGKATKLEKFQFEELQNNNPNDHRFQAFYTMSPDHTTLAVSRHGRVDCHRFTDGLRVQSIPFGDERDLPQVRFLSANRVLLTSARHHQIAEFDIVQNVKLAVFPEDNVGAVSPDGKHFASRRDLVPVGENRYMNLPVPLVTLWERTK